MRGGGSLWDSEIVAGVAFHPRKCNPTSPASSKGGTWVDSDISAADGTRIAYRLYTPPPPTSSSGVVLMYFHANAELCTDVESDMPHFYDCGFRAVLCPEFRGFAWSGGKPKLGALCPDAEDVLDALPEILSKAGVEIEVAGVVVHGRSLGSACAVHLAAKRTGISALVVESGVMSLMDLPMVQQLGMMMPQILHALQAEPCPLQTLAEMRQVTVPTLIIHGERDEISPVDQAITAHKACNSSAKKLVRYPRCHHNDVRMMAGSEYYNEMRNICEVVASGSSEALLQVEEPGDGFLAMITGAMKCIPGVRRCLASTVTP